MTDDKYPIRLEEDWQHERLEVQRSDLRSYQQTPGKGTQWQISAGILGLSTVITTRKNCRLWLRFGIAYQSGRPVRGHVAHSAPPVWDESLPIWVEAKRW
jgi:hypothetical protein